VSASVRLGTQGWSYPDWIGSFYPPGSKQEHYLPFYARVFDAVELDTTFYGPPRPSVVRSWARHTPPEFRFAAKLPRTITHEARLAGVAPALQEFVAALEPLGERLGPLLVQLPAEFVRDARAERDLAECLAVVPASVRLAVEFRHVSWQVAEVLDRLRASRVALAWTDWRDLPRWTEITTDFLYLRWIGHREQIERYDRIQIDRGDEFDRWQGALRRALPEVREVYGFFNNHWAGHGPASAAEMKRRLGLTPVDPRELWRQGQLW
jgi:uncharacterized protein YecE (DUF72 family)